MGYDHQEAIDFYERVLVILKKQDEYDRAARTLMKLGLPYHTAFDFQRSRGVYDEAAFRRIETAAAEQAKAWGFTGRGADSTFCTRAG